MHARLSTWPRAPAVFLRQTARRADHERVAIFRSRARCTCRRGRASRQSPALLPSAPNCSASGRSLAISYVSSPSPKNATQRTNTSPPRCFQHRRRVIRAVPRCRRRRPSVLASRGASSSCKSTRPMRGEDLASGTSPWTESFAATPRVSHKGQSQPSGHLRQRSIRRSVGARNHGTYRGEGAFDVVATLAPTAHAALGHGSNF